MAPETARIGVSDPRTDIYAVGVMFYEMLTGTIPFAGETAVDVMLKVVSEPVTPPRQRAPNIEITPEAEALIMKALAKDPLKRHQSMEELREELQQCYGSVRFRRSLEQRMAQPAPRRSEASGAIVTPTSTPSLRLEGTSPGIQATPILLTKKKQRRKTLPMDLREREAEAEAESAPPPPRTRPSPVVAAVEHDEWSEPALRTPPAQSTMDEWTDLDIDATE
jgi:serine/threonine-protein kinase